MINYLQWLYRYYEDAQGSTEEYILNLPFEDPSDQAEMGFYLTVYDNLKDEIDKMEFSWNNANLFSLKSDGEFEPLKPKDEISMLWKQTAKHGREVIKTMFNGKI